MFWDIQSPVTFPKERLNFKIRMQLTWKRKVRHETNSFFSEINDYLHVINDYEGLLINGVVN